MEYEIRTRSYSYAVPPRSLDAQQGLSGFEVLKRILAGELPPPPMVSTAGIELARVEPGEVDFEAEPAEWAENAHRSLHGGWVATILDSALGCAVLSALKPGLMHTTATLEVKYVRAVLVTSGRLRAQARVVHVGSRVAVAEARLAGVDDGKLYATGTTTCLVFEARESAPKR